MRDDPYLTSDAVFGVKTSLVVVSVISPFLHPPHETGPLLAIGPRNCYRHCYHQVSGLRSGETAQAAQTGLHSCHSRRRRRGEEEHREEKSYLDVHTCFVILVLALSPNVTYINREVKFRPFPQAFSE